MRHMILAFAFGMCVIPGEAMQEKSVVVTPVPVNKTVTEFEVTGFSFTRTPDWQLTITYTDNLNTAFTDTHTGTTTETNPDGASTLIIALNKANLSTKSLERRLLEHLVAEGKIPAATITGNPR